jgi:hypothetical protein
MALRRRCEKYGPPVAISRVNTVKVSRGPARRTYVGGTRSGKRNVAGSSGEQANALRDPEVHHRLMISISTEADSLQSLTVQLPRSQVQDLHMPLFCCSSSRGFLQAGLGQLYRRTRHVVMIMTFEQS